MKKEIFYQCLLEKRTEKATITTVSWIPKKYANKDQYVKLREKKEDGYTEWSDGWKVMKVCSRSEKEDIPDVRKQHMYLYGNNLHNV